MRKLIAVLLPLLACGGKEPYQAQVAPPQRGFQLVTPRIRVSPGDEQMWCSNFPPRGEDTLIAAVETYQAPGGHHAALFMIDADYTGPAQQRCDGVNSAVEMTQWRFLGSSSPAEGVDKFPEGVALLLPKGKTLMVQSHYLGIGGAIDARDVVNVVAGDPTKVWTLANYWILGDTGIHIPPGAYQTSADCAIDSDINVFDIRGHTHQYGTLFQLDRLSTGAQLYRATDGPLMRVDPPRVRFPLAAPLRLSAGEKLRYTCGWDNGSGHALKFPEEMCQGIILYYPSKGFVLCDGGQTSVLR